MSVLLPKKASFPQKFVYFYHKVFPSADKRYWRTYKLKICDEIKNLSVRDLSWEIIKGRAELDSKFTFIWSSVVFGVISAGIFTYGLDLATQVIVLGPATKEFMITTVYFDFLSMISLFTLVVSFAGWLVALIMELPGGRAWWFYGIFFVISVFLVVIGYLKHTIIIDFVFLLLNTFCIAILLGTVADLKKQRALIKISIMEDRLKELDKV